MPVRQKLKYNHLLIPKEHRDVCLELSTGIWNEINRIDTLFPDEDILISHKIKNLSNEYYTIDMELECKNESVQKLLNAAYISFMKLPRLNRPDTIHDSDFSN